MVVEPFATWPKTTKPAPKPKPTPTQTKSWESAYTAADAGSLGATSKKSAPASPPPPPSVPKVTAITDPEAASGFVASTGVGSMLNESQARRDRDEYDAAIAGPSAFVASTGVGSMLNESEAQRARDERFEAAATPMASFVSGTGVGSMLNESEAQRERDDFAAAIAPMEGFVGSTGVGSMLNESEARAAMDERADTLIEEHTGVVVGSGYSPVLQTRPLSYEIQELRRENPVDAMALEAAIAERLDEYDRNRFERDVATASEQELAAYGHLASYGIPGEGDIVLLEDEVLATASDIIEDATGTTAQGGSSIDPSQIEYRLDKLAQDDPALAIAVKRELDDRFDAELNGEVNRLLGGGANFHDEIDSAVNNPAGGIEGFGKSLINNVILAPINLAAGGSEGGSLLITPDVSGEPLIPYLEYEDSSQRGGAVIGTAVEVIAGGKGLVRFADDIILVGGRRILVREGGEAIADAGARQGDELVPGSAIDDVGAPPPTTIQGADDVGGINDTGRAADDLSPPPTTIPGADDVGGVADDLPAGQADDAPTAPTTIGPSGGWPAAADQERRDIVDLVINSSSREGVDQYRLARDATANSQHLSPAQRVATLDEALGEITDPAWNFQNADVANAEGLFIGDLGHSLVVDHQGQLWKIDAADVGRALGLEPNGSWSVDFDGGALTLVE